MIAYEDLVAALSSWRARNGLPTTPPDYGDPVPMVGAGAPPADVYDLSDDSGLIMTEDVMQAEDDGGIETAMEISAEEHARGDDYADSPGTDAYYQGDGAYQMPSYGDDDEGFAEVSESAVHEVADDEGLYAEEPAAAAYDAAPVDQYGDTAYGQMPEADAGYAGVEEVAMADDDYDAAPPPAHYDGTVDADPVDVIEEEPLDAAADSESDMLGADEDSGDDATVVAADPSEESDEPEALPPIGDDDDRY